MDHPARQVDGFHIMGSTTTCTESQVTHVRDKSSTKGSGHHGRHALAQALLQLPPTKRSLASTSASSSGMEQLLSWPQKYNQLLAANDCLKQQLTQLEVAHRKSLTVVKYAPTLPNNDVFTKQLVEENRQLLARYRALELKLATVRSLLDGLRGSSSSPRRSIDKTRQLRRSTQRKGHERLPVKHAGSQTDESSNIDSTSGGTDAAMAPSPLSKKEEASAPPMPASVPPEVLQLVTQFKERLSELHVDVERLRQENDLLRAERSGEQEENDELQGNRNKTMVAGAKNILRSQHEQDALEQMLQDRIRQMKILEAQFQHLKTKTQAKNVLYKQSLDKVEQLTAKLFDAKQTLLKQAEKLQQQDDSSFQVRALEMEVHALRSENSTLNEAVAVLSARPLDALDVQLEKKAIQVSMLEDDKARLEKQLDKQSQDNRVVAQRNDKLLLRVDTLVNQVETQCQELQQLQSQHEQFSVDREIAELKLQFYLSSEPMESKQLMDAVGRALKAIKSQERAGHSQGEADADGSTTVTDGCRRCRSIDQEPAPASQLHQERLAKMAEITNRIRDDSRAQLQDLKIAHDAQVRALRRQNRKWEQKANEYLHEITTLRHQQAQAQSSPSPSLWLSNKLLLTTGSRSNDKAVAQRGLVDQNMVELHIYDLRLDLHKGQTTAPANDPDASLFVVFCDYFDFEPQHSPVFSMPPSDAVVAPLDMEVSYKIVLDSSFCKSPVADLVAIELHKLHVSTSSVVGATTVSLKALFLSEKGSACLALKLLDPISKVPIGSFRVKLSLDHAVDHLYKVWSRSHSSLVRPPGPLFSGGGHVSTADHKRLVIRVVALVLADEVVATNEEQVKLRYRFMGHPSVRYAAESTSPSVFKAFGFHYLPVDRMKAYEIPSDKLFLEYLKRYELVFHCGGEFQANVSCKSLFCNDPSSPKHSSFSSVMITTASGKEGGGGAARPVGRLWLEMEMTTQEPTQRGDASSIKSVVLRVCGESEPIAAGGGRVDWQKFCDTMALTSTERAGRQLLQAKCGDGSHTPARSLLRQLILHYTRSDPCTGLSSVFDTAGIQMSRSELSFLSGSLFSTQQEDTSRASKRLALVLDMMDREWLAVEASLRRHIEKLGVALVAYDSADLIDWETFTQRIRLPFPVLYKE